MIDMNELLKTIEETSRSKDRNALIVQAKQNMLMVSLINKASPEELEKARQELIDAMIASVDAGIEAYQKAIAVVEKAK